MNKIEVEESCVKVLECCLFMKRQPLWDQFEVALLINAYIRISENGENKNKVLQEVSERLRNKARNEGIEIDDTFRNLNGMMWQIGFIECAFKKTGYGKREPSKMFQQMVDMYQNRKEDFMKIYERAISKSNECTVKDKYQEKTITMLDCDMKNKFIKWMHVKNLNENRIEYICNVFDEASTYACGHRVSKKAIWDLRSIYELNMFFEKLRNDRIYKVVHKESAKKIFKLKEMYFDFFESAYEENEHENEIEQDILDVVAKKYVYGYRLGSVIERMKLRDYLSEKNINYTGSDEELEEIIKKNGFISNGKVLIESKNNNLKLNQEIDAIFNTGVSAIYYEPFFEIKTVLMKELHIASHEALKDILKGKRHDLVFSKNYFSNNNKVTENIAVANEIIRVWGNSVILSVSELAERLPFVPYNKIKFYLSQNNNFIWVSEGMYTKLDSIIISSEEKMIIREYVAYEIEKKGFVSLNELPLESIFEENYELSESAILFGTYEKCLSDNYCLHGRIVTRMDNQFDAITLMEQFCSELNEITLDDAILKVKDFTGVADRRIAYGVLYSSMIRVSEQLFVTQKKVCFDIDKIDMQIEKFVRDDYIALKEVTTFALFPECGFTWNHYILESFCYKFSKKYLFKTNLFNGRNAGAIVSSFLTWDYQEIMAHAVARSGIDLKNDLIGNYLYDTGYMARSKFGGINEIAERARIIREEKN